MKLIDAVALIEIFDKDKYDLVRNEYQSGYNDGMFHAEVVTDNLPEVDAVPVKHGYWIDIDEQSYTWKVRCSCCGHERSMMSTQGEYPKYCEECGARMDEVEK